ncbi:hypothetical protein [Allochromatium tepidum]|uniref:hypothetical protein n=1 Tax=Allochromatium tepidum TaxID=553982 RepID=UPI001BCBEFFD|nr:hypothetical protein [Allochromatium tepidum]
MKKAARNSSWIAFGSEQKTDVRQTDSRTNTPESASSMPARFIDSVRSRSASVQYQVEDGGHAGDEVGVHPALGSQRGLAFQQGRQILALARFGIGGDCDQTGQRQ